MLGGKQRDWETYVRLKTRTQAEVGSMRQREGTARLALWKKRRGLAHLFAERVGSGGASRKAPRGESTKNADGRISPEGGCKVLSHSRGEREVLTWTQKRGTREGLV